MQYTFRCAKPLALPNRPLIMGIVNMTPDSFSGQNTAVNADDAVSKALQLLAAGADIVDIGAESSRPGSRPLTWREETARLADTVPRLRRETSAPISIDTYHPETADTVLAQGADIINDISALRGGWETEAGTDAMGRTVAAAGATAVLMHMPAIAPEVMQNNPVYRDVVQDVLDFLLARAARAEQLGVAKAKIWLDPGFGFGKTFQHNSALLLHLREFVATGYPVLAGLSRKRMIGAALGDVDLPRLEGSLVLALMAAQAGAAVVRVHDVPETYRALTVAAAVTAVGL